MCASTRPGGRTLPCAGSQSASVSAVENNGDDVRDEDNLADCRELQRRGGVLDPHKLSQRAPQK